MWPSSPHLKQYPGRGFLVSFDSPEAEDFSSVKALVLDFNFWPGLAEACLELLLKDAFKEAIWACSFASCFSSLGAFMGDVPSAAVSGSMSSVTWSPTEREFDWALDLGIPKCCLVRLDLAA